jgi:hypothetical protein
MDYWFILIWGKAVVEYGFTRNQTSLFLTVNYLIPFPVAAQ